MATHPEHTSSARQSPESRAISKIIDGELEKSISLAKDFMARAHSAESEIASQLAGAPESGPSPGARPLSDAAQPGGAASVPATSLLSPPGGAEPPRSHPVFVELRRRIEDLGGQLDAEREKNAALCKHYKNDMVRLMHELQDTKQTLGARLQEADALSLSRQLDGEEAAAALGTLQAKYDESLQGVLQENERLFNLVQELEGGLAASRARPAVPPPLSGSARPAAVSAPATPAGAAMGASMSAGDGPRRQVAFSPHTASGPAATAAAMAAAAAATAVTTASGLEDLTTDQLLALSNANLAGSVYAPSPGRVARPPAFASAFASGAGAPLAGSAAEHLALSLRADVAEHVQTERRLRREIADLKLRHAEEVARLNGDLRDKIAVAKKAEKDASYLASCAAELERSAVESRIASESVLARSAAEQQQSALALETKYTRTLLDHEGRIRDLVAELDNARALLAAKNTELEDLAADHVKACDQLARVGRAYDEYRGQAEEGLAQTRVLTETVEGEKAVLRQRAADLEEGLAAATARADALQHELDAATRAAANATADLGHARAQLAEARDARTQLEFTQDTLGNEVLALKAAAADAAARILHLNTVVADQEGQMGVLRDTVADMRARNKSLMAAICNYSRTGGVPEGADVDAGPGQGPDGILARLAGAQHLAAGSPGAPGSPGPAGSGAGLSDHEEISTMASALSTIPALRSAIAARDGALRSAQAEAAALRAAQAAAEDRAGRLSEELHAERLASTARTARLEATAEGAAAQLRALTAENARLNGLVSDANVKASRSQLEQHAAERDAADRVSRANGLLQSKAADYEGRSAALADELAQLKSASAVLKSKNLELNDALAARADEARALQAGADAQARLAQEQLAARDARVADLLAEVEEYKRAIDRLQPRLPDTRDCDTQTDYDIAAEKKVYVDLLSQMEDALRAQAREHDAARLDLQAQVATLTEEKVRLDSELQLREEGLAELRRALAEERGVAVPRLEDRVAALGEENRRLAACLEDVNAAGRRSADDASATVGGLLAKNKELELGAAELSRLLGQADADMKMLRATVASLEKSKVDLQRMFDDLSGAYNDDIVTTRAMHEAASAENARLRAQQGAFETEKEVLREELNGAAGTVAQLRSDNARLLVSVDDLTGQLRRLQEEFTGLLESTAALKGVAQENRQLRAQADALERAIERLQGENKALVDRAQVGLTAANYANNVLQTKIQEKERLLKDLEADSGLLACHARDLEDRLSESRKDVARANDFTSSRVYTAALRGSLQDKDQKIDYLERVNTLLGSYRESKAVTRDSLSKSMSASGQYAQLRLSEGGRSRPAGAAAGSAGSAGTGSAGNPAGAAGTGTAGGSARRTGDTLRVSGLN